MHVVCSSTSEGNVYRLYGDEDEDASAELKPLVPLLIRSGVDMIVGDGHGHGHSRLLLIVGPLKGKDEQRFLRVANSQLNIRPVPCGDVN